MDLGGTTRTNEDYTNGIYCTYNNLQLRCNSRCIQLQQTKNSYLSIYWQYFAFVV